MKSKRNRCARVLLWCVTAACAAGVFWLYARDRTPLPAAAAPPATVQPGPALDLNWAGAAELDELPGIGPALAERILAYREENGPFAGPEELLAVPGIGPAIWEDISPFVCFGEEGTRRADTGGG